MTDFSDRPLVAGSLIGLRSFCVDELGRLTGIHQKAVFTPEENLAECKADPYVRNMQRTLSLSVERMYASGVFPMMIERPTPSAGAKDHVVGSVDCACGFYAYFDGGNDYADKGDVTALIEGYGVCTVGDRGFRASKARLVAFVAPGRKPWRKLRLADLRLPSWVWVILTVLAALGLVRGVLHHHWFSGVIGGASLALDGWMLACARKHERRRSSARNSTLDRIRANYPEVPVYPSRRVALREHPLTPPPPPVVPTPETDADFWTRGVR